MSVQKNRKLAEYFPSLSSYDSHSGRSHMLSQDMSTAVAPLNIYSSGSTHEFKIIGSDSVAGTLLLKNFVPDRGRYSNTELVSEVVNDLAMSLFYSGKCVFEISKSESGMSVHSVTLKRLFWIPGYYFQIVPKKDILSIGKALLYCRSSSIWELSLPSALGSFYRYRAVQILLRFADGVTPKFAFDHIMKNDSIFDLKKYSYVRACFVSVLTKRYRWSQRSLSNEYISEFYLIYRNLHYKSIKALVRSHILSELNKLFKRLEYDAKIEEAGLPSASDYLDLLSDIKSQKKPLISFTQYENLES